LILRAVLGWGFGCEYFVLSLLVNLLIVCSLAVVCILPLPAFWWVDLDKGREDALNMAELKSRGKGIRNE
jgi:hypothetical protein